MMDAFERFGLLINNRIVRTPVAIASMAGMVDSSYVLERADHIGAAFIGGYFIDQPTMDAAKSVTSEGTRKEFLYDNPAEELKKQMALMEKSAVGTWDSTSGAVLLNHSEPWRDHLVKVLSTKLMLIAGSLP